MFLDDGQQLERRPARLLRAGLPFLYRALTRVEVAGEYRLADIVRLAEPLDLGWRNPGRHGQVTRIEITHGRLADRADLA